MDESKLMLGEALVQAQAMGSTAADQTTARARSRLLQDTAAKGARNSTELSVAATKVFAIPEMLEHILSFLPFRDLLLAQRISEQFQQAIAASTKLRKKLHLVPNTSAALHIRDSIHPLVPRSICVYSTMQVSVASVAPRNVERPGHQSWRDMLLTQPPLKRMTCALVPRNVMEERVVDVETLYCENGITLGALVDYGLSVMAKTAARGGDGWIRASFTAKKNSWIYRDV
ncbi:hypothetical protein LTR85_000246 [Meristemomyces frigidus]|nr:hypothetical protein LTR85_000246 [Meristemomyces frigidus]